MSDLCNEKKVTDIDVIISELLSKNDYMTDAIEYNSLPISIRKRLLYQKSIGG